MRFQFTAEDAGGVAQPTDPSEVVVRVKPPNAAAVVYRFSLDEVEKEETGVYHLDVSLDRSGVWYVRGEGTGAVEAAKTETFRVRNDPFTT